MTPHIKRKWNFRWWVHS